VPGPTIDPAELDFVLEADTSGIEVRRRPGYDLYTRPATERPPLAVLVHGPVRGPGARPREWPVYRGYASLLAHAGLAAAIVDLDYTDVHALTGPIAQLRRSVDDARAEATVDGDARRTGTPGNPDDGRTTARPGAAGRVDRPDERTTRFDMLDHDDRSRQAVRDALTAVVRLLA
jgi:hypothetical protein